MDSVTFYLKTICILHTVGCVHSIYYKKWSEAFWGMLFTIWPLYILWSNQI